MLAIVIPYYKHQFFKTTLESLSSQSNTNFKVYIGDDNSLDNPIDLLNNYVTTLNITYNRFETNLGSISLTQQWERCLDMVKEEPWVMILGDDDIISDNFVDQFYRHLNEINKVKFNVVRFASVVINEDGEQLSKLHKHPKLERSTDFLMRKLQGGTRSSLSEFVFRKEVLDEVKFKNLPLAWYSDYLAVLECTYFGNMYTINDAFMSFRISGLNITSKKDNLTVKNIASFRFYYYLLKDKSVFFNANQKEKLYSMIEKTFLDNKRSVNFWRLFSSLYCHNFQVKRYIFFLVKMVKVIFKF